jgi:hypothetical protein
VWSAEKRAEGLEYMHPKPSSHSGRIVGNPEVIQDWPSKLTQHRSVREIGSDTRAVVEELAQTDGEDEIAEDRVVETGERQRSGVLVGEGKQETPYDAED